MFLTDQPSDKPYTFVVDQAGLLRLSPRRSEHVACAGGQPVLAAGEISFTTADSGWPVSAVSNQSTGYCPDPDCWSAVAASLDQAQISRSNDFTDKLLLRRCPGCGERNVIKDGWFVCAHCDTDLPAHWNFPASDPDQTP